MLREKISLSEYKTTFMSYDGVTGTGVNGKLRKCRTVTPESRIHAKNPVRGDKNRYLC